MKWFPEGLFGKAALKMLLRKDGEKRHLDEVGTL